MTIKPTNHMAQIMHRTVGSPASTLPDTAISNCFPGLEFDFKQFWRRAFIGIVLQEWDNYVVDIEDPALDRLKHRRLLRVGDFNVVTLVTGPVIPGGADDGLTVPPEVGALTMEWSNALAFAMREQGNEVSCLFTETKAAKPVAPPADPVKAGHVEEVRLKVRRLVETSGAPSLDALRPGELTQGLCSPWQHDYRECACYYWPATRPDFVNVKSGSDGLSHGGNWMSKERTGRYVLDDRVDGRLLTYDDLFSRWEALLKFQIRGRDSDKG